MNDKPESGRASIFSDEENDVSDFLPRKKQAQIASLDEVKAISEGASFRSREPMKLLVQASIPKDEGSDRREMRRYRTGRNVQLNLKVRQADADAFYALADREGLVLGEIFARAIAALTRELG